MSFTRNEELPQNPAEALAKTYLREKLKPLSRNAAGRAHLLQEVLLTLGEQDDVIPPNAFAFLYTILGTHAGNVLFARAEEQDTIPANVESYRGKQILVPDLRKALIQEVSRYTRQP